MNSIKLDIFEPIALSLRNESHNLEPIKSSSIDLKTKATNYIVAATSQNTRKAYRHDIQHFMK